MKYSEISIITKEYGNAFRKHAKDGIIDMDACMKHTFNFHIHRIEEAIPAWEGIIPAYRQSQFVVALIKKGRGEKTIGHFSFPIQKNVLYVVPKRVPHSSRYYSLNCSGFLLSFDMAFFGKHFSPQNLIANKGIFNRSARPFMILTNKQAGYLSAIFEYLYEEYNRQFINKDEMLAVKVIELLIQCERYFTGAAPYPNEDSYSELVESFNELIQVHFSMERSVQFYANALHIHPNYLNLLMKKYTGLTAKQTIADHIFLEAKGLLGSPSLSIKEISYKLGFATPGCFSSFFSKMSAMSPSKYRQQMLHL